MSGGGANARALSPWQPLHQNALSTYPPQSSSSLTFFHIHGPREGRSASISAAVILVCCTFLAGCEYSHVNI